MGISHLTDHLEAPHVVIGLAFLAIYRGPHSGEGQPVWSPQGHCELQQQLSVSLLDALRRTMRAAGLSYEATASHTDVSIQLFAVL